MSNVTLSAKRYRGLWTYVCAGCGGLADSSRSDTLTCSAACRVRAHRNGSLKALRAMAVAADVRDKRTGKLDVALILHWEATKRLLPDLAQDVLDGRLTITQAQPAVHHELIRRLVAELEGATP